MKRRAQQLVTKKAVFHLQDRPQFPRPFMNAINYLLTRQGLALRIQQPYLMSGISEWATDHQETQGNLMTGGQAGGESQIRGVDQEDL